MKTLIGQWWWRTWSRFHVLSPMTRLWLCNSYLCTYIRVWKMLYQKIGSASIRELLWVLFIMRLSTRVGYPDLAWDSYTFLVPFIHPSDVAWSHTCPVSHKSTRQSPLTLQEPGNAHMHHHHMHHHHEHHRPSQTDTKYVSMLLALDDIPQLHNMLASFFTWILLAGFVLFPGTFTSLQNSEAAASSEVGRQILKAVAHVPL